MGELLEIWLKENHGQPMVPLTEAEVRAGEGIKDSAKEPHADRQEIGRASCRERV